MDYSLNFSYKHNDFIEKSELLINEAKQYYNLRQEEKKGKLFNSPPIEGCLLEKSFFKKWKQYVNYSYLKTNDFITYDLNNFLQNPYPGPITNYLLLVPLSEFYNDNDKNKSENIVIKNGMKRRKDYKIINEKMWYFFYEKYAGGPLIKRFYHEETTRILNHYTLSQLDVDIHRKLNIVILPMKTYFTCEKDVMKLFVKPVYIPKNENLKYLKDHLINLIKIINTDKNLKDLNIRIHLLESNFSTFINEMKDKIENLINNHYISLKCLKTLDVNTDILRDEMLNITDKDIFLIEVFQNNDYIFSIDENYFIYKDPNYYGRSISGASYPCYSENNEYQESSFKYHEVRSKLYSDGFSNEKNEQIKSKIFEKSNNGTVGLKNLGNTCFMNAALQCMSNCQELTNYFLEFSYKIHINKNNPIGSKGILVEAYADLITKLWNGSQSVINPLNFKDAIEKFQKMYIGHNQHDSHEFLSYLIDGLHEDLNKVLKKPYIEDQENIEESHVKSTYSWIKFLRRNQSIMIDLFYGQFKSTVFCQSEYCHNVSITYDNYITISLPILSKVDPYFIPCFFIFYDISIQPLFFEIPFYVECSVMALRNKISELLNIHPFSFVIGKLDSFICIDYLLSSSSTLLKTSNDKKKVFLYQINPELFYSQYNKLYKDIRFRNRDYTLLHEELIKSNKNLDIFSEKYEENEEGQTNHVTCYYSEYCFDKINIDDNYGFNNFIPVVMIMKILSDNGFSRSFNARRVIYPRLIFINKNWSTKEVYFQIFKFFFPLIKKTLELKYDYEVSEIFNSLFKDYEEEYKKSYSKMDFPFQIRIKNNENYDNCLFCRKKTCENCLLPFSEEITINELLRKIPKNEGIEIDNTFLFLNETQRRKNIKNRDFSLEIIFDSKYINYIKILDDFINVFKPIDKTIPSKSVTIYDCFRNFSKFEVLNGNNEWYCDKCKNHTNAKKKMELYKIPPILIINLKRFNRNNKINTLIEYPLIDLDLKGFVKGYNKEENLFYDLFAVCNHEGTLNGGHYYAYCFNNLKEEWYKFNDSIVNPVRESDVISSSAYLLFYRSKMNYNSNIIKDLYTKPFEDFENLSIEK